MRWALLCAAIIAGCASKPVTMKARDVATLTPDSGAVGVKVLADPTAASVKLGADEDYRQPGLYPQNELPVYPPELIPLHLDPYTVVLRVTFDEEGKAIQVTQSPVAASTDGPHRAAFEAATTNALYRWRCHPPAIRKFRPGADLDGDGKPDYRVLAAQRILKTFFDLSFDFAVVNGVPVVKKTAK